MNINELIKIVKKKLENNIIIQDLKIEDKSFLHKKHKNNQNDRFHLKLTLKSQELIKLNKVNAIPIGTPRFDLIKKIIQRKLAWFCLKE